MDLHHGTCYRALRSRDTRFDGRFFTGVTSTGVYCRPICPARTPKAANCIFFACAAAAEEAGFRPCRRCRPETAPGTPAWRGSSTSVSRALRLIADGALIEDGVEELAARLGLSGRQLRRLFNEQLGASPLAVANTGRVHFAKGLIEASTLPLTQVALAAGYANSRRFNAAVRACFDRTPSEIRRAVGPCPDPGRLTLRLAYREPLDWQGLLGYLAPRAIPGVEFIVRDRYLRSLAVGDFTGAIEVFPEPTGRPRLLLRAPVAAAGQLADLVARARACFDLDADPLEIHAQLAEDPRLGPALGRIPGLRVPGAWDSFELALRAVLGQQVTVAGATRLAGRLVERFGRPLPPQGALPGGPTRLFPRPADLADADVAAIGLPAARAETIRALSRALLDDPSFLELAPNLQSTLDGLLAIPGIGDWTAQYIAMRALNEPDAFPAGDLCLRKALADDDKPLAITRVRGLAEAWRPWRAYAAMLLWREAAAERKERR